VTTLEIQKALNQILKANGKTLLMEDGKLGPLTCAAAKQYMTVNVPAGCTTTSTASEAKATVTTAPMTTTSNMSLLSSTKWIIGSSIAIALGLVGWAVAQKKGWIG
jgi:hypothetical protein